MKRVFFLIIILCLVGINSVFSQENANIEYTNCFFPVPSNEVLGETIDCGVFIVPQDRNEPDGLQIKIAFAVLYSTSSDRYPDPIIYLEGGPGGSALSGIDSWVNFAMRETRDLILFDQRGAGYSSPRLYCADIDESDLMACREQLESEGVDIADYNTINNAQDTYELLMALGYSEWNLLGISYGTRLALNIMRDFPDGIRSVIIDSVYPPVVDAYEEEVVNVYRPFRQLFDDCVADVACDDAFPDLESRFYDLVDSLQEAPIVLADDTELDGAGLLNTMFEWFYDTAIIPYLPLMIDELANGGQSVLEALQDGSLPLYDGAESGDPISTVVGEFIYLSNDTDDDTYYAIEAALGEWDLSREGLLNIFYEYFDEADAEYLEELLADVADDQMERILVQLGSEDEGNMDEGEDVSDTQGMFDAVECYEEVPFNSVDDQAELNDSMDMPSQYYLMVTLKSQIETCAIWQSETAPQSETEAIFSDIPTLVLAGNYDPVTPPVWGQIAAETLSNSTYAEFPGVGHSAVDGGDCPLGIALSFIDDPYASLDLSCIDTMQVQFVTEIPDLSGE